jgi:hypothetical protein
MENGSMVRLIFGVKRGFVFTRRRRAAKVEKV